MALFAGSLGLSTFSGDTAEAATLVPVSGAGSTWSSNAMDQWIADIHQYGIEINYAPTGSSDGRNQFRNATADFAVSEIPYGVTDNGVADPPPTNRSFSYMPIVAGGTSFMYQLHIDGQMVTNLRLSGLTLAKIYTDNITNWSDPAIAADNPGITLPARPIVPVVRTDGSGTTAQLTTWLATEYPALWNAYCGKVGRQLPCGTTSEFPILPGSNFIGEQLSTGVAGYVTQSQSEGTIGYVEASYAIEAGYPLAKVLNVAGDYVEPTADNVAVALTAAQINMDPTSPLYLTQQLQGVYTNPDPRAYPLSSYSYMIIPTSLQSPMTNDKGYTLGKFAYYFLCQGQQAMPQLGYSPLPINLVQAALTQVAKIPGVDVQSLNIAGCNNPTFNPDGSNRLATIAPQPQACDQVGVTMCPNGTGGDLTPTTVVSVPTVVTTTAPPTTPAKAPAKTAPKKATPGSPVTKAAPKTTAPGQPPAGATTTVVPGQVGVPPGTAVSVSPGAVPSLVGPAKNKAGTTVASPVSAAPGAGPAAPQDADQPGGVTDPVATAPGQGTTGQGTTGNGTADVAEPVLIRAVPVSLANSTGWTLQDTLMVFAVLLAALITVGPPLLSRRLSRKKAS